MELPIDFKIEMKNLLKSDFNKFISCYNSPPYRGLRVNTLKVSLEKFKKIINMQLSPTPFADNNFYISNEIQKIGTHPLHHAGAFYVQEPSASFAVTVLDVKPGEKILDLCASPGGKSTQIAEKLGGTGLLWANEVIKNRAHTLLSNIERMGIRNAVVSNCKVDILCHRLSGFFDKVLVDAPCSGEGMFRKNPQAIDEWSKEYSISCARRQLEILNCAKFALKENGKLVYSTCTFSSEENEKVICKFLKENDDFEISEIKHSCARNADSAYSFAGNNLAFAKRITPIECGEGHFVAKLVKKSHQKNTVPAYKIKSKEKDLFKAEKLFRNLFSSELYGQLEKINNNFFILPYEMPDIKNLNVMRAGVLFAEGKKSHIEPHHAVFMAAKENEINNKINFHQDSNEIAAFLKGEEIPCSNCQPGYIGITVEGIPIGFGKYSNGKIKNKYPKGLRNL